VELRIHVFAVSPRHLANYRSRRSVRRDFLSAPDSFRLFMSPHVVLCQEMNLTLAEAWCDQHLSFRRIRVHDESASLADIDISDDHLSSPRLAPPKDPPGTPQALKPDRCGMSLAFIRKRMRYRAVGGKRCRLGEPKRTFSNHREVCVLRGCSIT